MQQKNPKAGFGKDSAARECSKQRNNMENARDRLLIYDKFSLKVKQVRPDKAQFQLYMKCNRTFTCTIQSGSQSLV